MEGHPGASRVTSAKDKTEFLKQAAIVNAAAFVGANSFDTKERIATHAVMLAEITWDELKKRGHV